MTDPIQIAPKKYSDIKAEAYIVETDYPGLLNDEKLAFSNGGFRRPYRSDIENIHSEDQNNFQVEREIIELNRAGLYDSFPELLFHRSKKSKSFKTVEEMREDHIFNNEIEENTRRFFWPLDHYLIKIKCQIYASETNKNNWDRNKTSTSLKEFWGIPSFFSAERIVNLTHIMPYAKEICMNIGWIEQTFRLILDMDVTIEKTLKSVDFTAPGKAGTMGTGFLGSDITIGNTFKIARYFLEIRIGPIDKKTADTFAQGEKNNKALGFLIETFVPVDFNVEVKYNLDSDCVTTLNKEDKNNSILGLTSIL